MCGRSTAKLQHERWLWWKKGKVVEKTAPSAQWVPKWRGAVRGPTGKKQHCRVPRVAKEFSDAG